VTKEIVGLGVRHYLDLVAAAFLVLVLAVLLLTVILLAVAVVIEL
jgi:hypothetical protein